MSSPDPRKTLNRHDHPAQALGTRVTKDMNYGLFTEERENALMGS